MNGAKISSSSEIERIAAVDELVLALMERIEKPADLLDCFIAVEQGASDKVVQKLAEKIYEEYQTEYEKGLNEIVKYFEAYQTEFLLLCPFAYWKVLKVELEGFSSPYSLSSLLLGVQFGNENELIKRCCQEGDIQKTVMAAGLQNRRKLEVAELKMLKEAVLSAEAVKK